MAANGCGFVGGGNTNPTTLNENETSCSTTDDSISLDLRQAVDEKQYVCIAYIENAKGTCQNNLTFQKSSQFSVGEFVILTSKSLTNAPKIRYLSCISNSL